MVLTLKLCVLMKPSFSSEARRHKIKWKNFPAFRGFWRRVEKGEGCDGGFLKKSVSEQLLNKFCNIFHAIGDKFGFWELFLPGKLHLKLPKLIFILLDHRWLTFSTMFCMFTQLSTNSHFLWFSNLSSPTPDQNIKSSIVRYPKI